MGKNVCYNFTKIEKLKIKRLFNSKLKYKNLKIEHLYSIHCSAVQRGLTSGAEPCSRGLFSSFSNALACAFAFSSSLRSSGTVRSLSDVLFASHCRQFRLPHYFWNECTNHNDTKLCTFMFNN